MNTIILYKVVYLNSDGIFAESFYSTEADARAFASSVNNPVIYKYALIGQMERIL